MDNKNKPYDRALVLMTALLPTIGHKNLIEYAYCLAKEVNVLVSIRQFEPIGGYLRFSSLTNEFYYKDNIKFFLHSDNKAPQNSSDTETEKDFWDYWKHTIEDYTYFNDEDYSFFNDDDHKTKNVVVASESYGQNIADAFNCTFIPYDLNRQINFVKSTDVRNNIVDNFDQILPVMQKELKTTATIFGAESCYKSTMTEYLANNMNGYSLFEWARPYLENLNNPIVNEEHMKNINIGQKALQKHALLNLHNKPFVFQDTDLLSTIGYYKIMNMKVPDSILEDFKETQSEIYYLMASNVPFVPDPLRYGGDKRESDDLFWIKLLEQYNCNWVYVNQDSFQEKFEAIKNNLLEYTEKKFYEIKNFKRD